MRRIDCYSFFVLYRKVADLRSIKEREFEIVADNNTLFLLFLNRHQLLDLIMKNNKCVSYEAEKTSDGLRVYDIVWVAELPHESDECDSKAADVHNEQNSCEHEDDNGKMPKRHEDQERIVKKDDDKNGEEDEDSDDKEEDRSASSATEKPIDSPKALRTILEDKTDSYIFLSEPNLHLLMTAGFREHLLDGNTDLISKIGANIGFYSFSYRYYPDQLDDGIYITSMETYPGVKAYYAYKNHNMNVLSDRERKMLDKAISIAEQCKSADERQTAWNILRVIAENTVYYTDEDPHNDNDSAIGVLLNGKADCDGYSDAFFLIGSLGGLTVRLQLVTSLNKEQQDDHTAHMVNLIKIDGTWRFLDCTWSSGNKKSSTIGQTLETCFDIGCDRGRLMYKWDEETTVEIREDTDPTRRPDNEYIINYPAEIEPAFRKSLAAGQRFMILIFKKPLAHYDLDYYSGVYVELCKRGITTSRSKSTNTFFIKQG